MRRPTGPGQVEVTPSIPTCRARSIRALLFNFDIDDATVKPEHQRWLEQNIVPLLAIRGSRLGLRGTASRTGTDTYNQRLSERRVAAVLDFLLARGAQRSQIDPTAVGEDDARRAGERDGTEDPRFRAVVVALDVPLSNLPVHFDRLDPTDRNDGFDDSVSPPWLLIPYELPFDVVRIVNGQGMTLISTNPAVARPVDPVNPGQPLGFVTENPDFIRIEAGLPGDAEIQALDACGNVVARLSISVLEKLTVRTAFHYVQNRGVGTRTRRLGDEVAFLQTMNDIYLPQANIEFVSIQAHDLPIADNLGNEVNTIGNFTNGEWNNIAGHGNANARFNVFFVREIETDAEGTRNSAGRITDTADAITALSGRDCIFEDAAGVQVGETLAHEAGHALGADHDSPVHSSLDMLMWPFTDERGQRIPRVHALLMRRSV